MMSFEPEISATPSLDEVQFLEDRIYEFNSRVTGIGDGELLGIFVRDDHDKIIAGLAGNSWGGCLEIRQFWVEESRRKQGVGSRLLAAAEAEARRRGCGMVLLMTFSFQAPEFYARHGFTVVAEVPDHPQGHRNLLMVKSLEAGS